MVCRVKQKYYDGCLQVVVVLVVARKQEHATKQLIDSRESLSRISFLLARIASEAIQSCLQY